jgi:hypothetical protein
VGVLVTASLIGSILFVGLHVVLTRASERRWNEFDSATIVLAMTPGPLAALLGARDEFALSALVLGLSVIATSALAWRHSAPPIALGIALLVTMPLLFSAGLERNLPLLIIVFVGGSLVWNGCYLVGGLCAAFWYSGGYGYAPDRCQRCGYPTAGLKGNRCPECGGPI